MPGTCHIHRSTKPSYYPIRQSQNRKIVNNYEVKIKGAGSKPQMNIEYDRLPHESFRDSASRGYDLRKKECARFLLEILTFSLYHAGNLLTILE